MTIGKKSSIFNFLSQSNSQGSGPLAPTLESLDWVSGLTSGLISQVIQPGCNIATLPTH